MGWFKNVISLKLASRKPVYFLFSWCFLLLVSVVALKKCAREKEILDTGNSKTGIIYSIDNSKSMNTVGERYYYFYIVDGQLHSGVSLYNMILDNVRIGRLVTVRFNNDSNSESVVERIEETECDCTILKGTAPGLKGELSVQLESGEKYSAISYTDKTFFVPITHGEKNIVSFFADGKLMKRALIDATDVDVPYYTIEAELETRRKRNEEFDLMLEWDAEAQDYVELIPTLNN